MRLNLQAIIASLSAWKTGKEKINKKDEETNLNVTSFCFVQIGETIGGQGGSGQNRQNDQRRGQELQLMS